MKQPYVENYIHGLYNLNAYGDVIEEIVSSYDKVFVTVKMKQDTYIKATPFMQQIGWKFEKPDKNETAIWSYYTGLVTR